MDFNYRLKPGRKRKTRDDAKCLVCDGPSIGLNFGVQTCSPCKAFFRRNAVKLGVCYFNFIPKNIFILFSFLDI
jgi:hypothetical protein